MSAEKFTSRPVPSQASPALREYLDDQISRLQLLVNSAALREEEETISGDWVFSGLVSFTSGNTPPLIGSRLSTDMLFLDGKEAIDGNDIWLRLNQNGDFTSGVYIPGNLRLDGTLFLNANQFQLTTDGSNGLIDLAANLIITTGNNSIIAFEGAAVRLTNMTHGLMIGGTTGNSVYLQEVAAARSDFAGWGQLWVKNTTPCQLWFTDDAGNDTQIV